MSDPSDVEAGAVASDVAELLARFDELLAGQRQIVDQITELIARRTA